MSRAKPPFKIVKISGQPYDRGYDYGSHCKDLINRLVESHYTFYNKYFSTDREPILDEARKFIPSIQAYSEETSEEMKGTAKGANVKHEEIVMLTAFPELLYPRLLGACTSFAVGSDCTSDNQVYLGQNEDEGIDPWLDGECSVLLSLKRKTGPDSLIYTYAGIPAMKGMNSSGIALCVNGLTCEKSEVGVPSLVVCREIMYKERIGDVIGAIFQAKRASSWNFALADKNGELYDIETTPADIHCHYSYEFYTHSNHFMYPGTKSMIKKDCVLQGLPDTVIRYNRMRRLIETNKGRINVSVLMSVLRDHVNYPNSICRHVNLDDAPQNRSKTLDSMMFAPSKLEAWFAKGPPCQAIYYCFGIDGELKSTEE